MNQTIDFVMPWVDSGDPAWIEEFNNYAPKKKDISIDIREERFRDNGLLRYWFRGIERYAPWVNKIFFITNGQKPAWLNINNKKLRWIKHTDYIPQEYLPTFSSHPIEIHLHRIPELSEQFVYFNDDMYLINPVKPDFFFKNNLPRDYAVLKQLQPSYFEHIPLNDLIELNNHYNKKQAVKKSFFKYINPIYGKQLLRSLFLFFSGTSGFPGFFNQHTPQAYLKETFKTVWAECEETLVNTSKNRFRNIADVNQYLFRYWQLAAGTFIPQAAFKEKYCGNARRDVNHIKQAINNGKIKELCIDDDDSPANEFYDEIADCFAKKFPHKSAFEI